MKNGALTYGQLADKLRNFGYVRRQREIDGRPAQAFEHPDHEGALILLPEAPPEQEVETPYQHKVLIILRTHGLIEEKNPLLT